MSPTAPLLATSPRSESASSVHCASPSETKTSPESGPIAGAYLSMYVSHSATSLVTDVFTVSVASTSTPSSVSQRRNVYPVLAGTGSEPYFAPRM